MTYFGFCWSIGDGVPPVRGLQVARSIFGPQTLIRTGPDLGDLFADPDLTKANWSRLDETYANCMEAGIHFYCNSVNLPAHATGGVPAYQTQIGGAGAQLLVNHGLLVAEVLSIYQAVSAYEAFVPAFVPDPRDPTPLTRVQFVLNALAMTHQGRVDPVWLATEFLKHYDAERAHTWTSDDPAKNGGGGPWHVWGEPGFEEADRITAPRPWLLDWSKIPPANLRKVREMARLVGARYRNARFHGFGNEFGGVGYNIDMRFDGANVPGGPDTVKDRLGPMLTEYYRGLWEVTSATTVGFEHDGIDIMRRCDDHVLFEPQHIFYHPYPSGGKSSIEKCRTEWWPALDTIITKDSLVENARGEGIGEIGGDPMELVQFAADVMRERPQTKAFIVLKIGYYVDGFMTDNPQMNAAGMAMQKMIRGLNAKHRAVGK